MTRIPFPRDADQDIEEYAKELWFWGWRTTYFYEREEYPEYIDLGGES